MLVGAAIGVLAGVFAWPRGGGGELHRATSTFLTGAAGVIRETVAVMARGQQPGAAMPSARLAGQLADASFALYQSERHPAATVDWQATLLAGHHAVRGAEALLRSCPAGGLLPCVEPLTALSEDVAGRYDEAAEALARHGGMPSSAGAPVGLSWPTDLGQDLYIIADLRVWLDGLREDIGAIGGRPEGVGGLRARVAQLADGAT
ncbi:hypothetical protein ACQPZX_27085 [Actinoplanes sp. CA-142083]|uniref:hypothetical protein n=1 Tax=Actinoplanes sp. CA-142083 TaxID=3239903 RepID=UPI003D8AD969